MFWWIVFFPHVLLSYKHQEVRLVKSLRQDISIDIFMQISFDISHLKQILQLYLFYGHFYLSK